MDFISSFVALITPYVASSLTKYLYKNLDKTDRDKIDYAQKIEQASSGDKIFKYLLLINLASLESYVTQTRLQAEQSFRLSRVVATIGFSLLAAGVVIGIFSQLFMQRGLEVAYLASVAGLITEFISGVFFYLYNKTLQQINLFHAALQSSQKIAMSFMMTSLIKDEAQRDLARIESAKILLSTGAFDSYGEVHIPNVPSANN